MHTGARVIMQSMLHMDVKVAHRVYSRPNCTLVECVVQSREQAELEHMAKLFMSAYTCISSWRLSICSKIEPLFISYSVTTAICSGKQVSVMVTKSIS